MVLNDLFTGPHGETDIENRLRTGEEGRRGWVVWRVTRKVALPYVKREQTGICCKAQETWTGALYQTIGVGWGGRWEGGSKGRGYMYTYGWFMLSFDRKQQNSVKQLSFDKK